MSPDLITLAFSLFNILRLLSPQLLAMSWVRDSRKLHSKIASLHAGLGFAAAAAKALRATTFS